MAIGNHTIELEIAGDRDRRGGPSIVSRERRETIGIGCTLCGHAREAREGGSHQCGPAFGGRERFRRQPRVGEQHRHPRTRRGGHQVGPDLGLHHDSDDGPPMAQERGRRMRVVVRQVRMRHALAEQRDRRLAAGRRHVRDQQVQIVMRGQQRFDQRRGRARLAHRDGVDPEAGTLHALLRATRPVAAEEALAPAAAIRGLATRSPQQIGGDERRRDEPQRAVGRARDSLADRHAEGATDGASAAARDDGGADPSASRMPSCRSPSRTPSRPGCAPSSPKLPRLIARGDQ